MNKNSGIAVIGSGYWGKNLVRNYHELGVLKVICDKNETLLDGFKEQYPGIDVCLAFNDVLNRDDIDALVLATPAETHYRLAREALLVGKHVYVEKPLVLDENEGVELIDLADSKKLILMVGHLLQYHPVFVKLKELATSGELGRINYIYSNRLNLGKIRREENALWSFAPHDISMILSLAGEEPENVYATGGCYLHKKIADVTTTHLEFPSGLRAHIFVSWLHPYKEQKLIVVGDRKMAVFDDTQPWKDKLLLYPHQIHWQNNIPIPDKADAERLDIPEDEPLRQECRHFLSCMENGCKPITDGSEGLRVLKILKAAQYSLDNDFCRISLDNITRTDPAERSSRDTYGNSIEVNSGHRPPEYFIHETAVVDDGCNIGKGAKIWHFSHILSNSHVGEDCSIGQNVVVGPDVTIGKGCKIQNNVSVFKGVTLEDEVFCGPGMVFTNVYNPRAGIRKMDEVRPTLAKHGSTLGANCTIVCGNTIGEYAFVGAGALINRNILDYELVVGNPVRHIGWACQCGERLTDEFECLVCKKRYERIDSGLVLI